MVKFGAFLHDVGKPASMRRKDGKITFHGHERVGLDIAEKICRRLKLSNDEINSLRLMILWHLRPGFLADVSPLTARAKFRFFRDTRQESISVLLISLADQRATKGPYATKESRLRHERLVVKLIKEHFKKAGAKAQERLVDGNDIMKELGIEPSPLVGRILSELEELRAIGRIKDKKQALQAARKLSKRAKR